MQNQPQRQMPVETEDDTASAARSRKSASAFRTISEVAELLDVQQHVLRFWETKFSQVRPLKRGGGRRYYRPEDVELLSTIHNLLYTQGYTIKGVQKLLKEQGKNAVLQAVNVQANDIVPPIVRPAQAEEAKAGGSLNPRQRAALESMLGELKELRRMLGTIK